MGEWADIAFGRLYAARPQPSLAQASPSPLFLSPSLTLSCKLGRDTMFQEMLEMSCVEFWRYSNITCCGYPLGALDSIMSDGSTNWGSAIMLILQGLDSNITRAVIVSACDCFVLVSW